jgi:hypothetical protein
MLDFHLVMVSLHRLFTISIDQDKIESATLHTIFSVQSLTSS